MSGHELRTPYLVFLGAATNPLDAKTGRGLVDWRPGSCAGQLRLEGATVDLGLADMTPAEAHAAGARSLVIGVAPLGGGVAEAWLPILGEALAAGLDLVSGMHGRLSQVPELVELAELHGRRLVDVRVPPTGLSVGTGRRRIGRRILTVGTDCCVGKKYTALALERELVRRGTAATFRATGQTGILIAGSGLPMDAVVSDFLAGAAEILSPDADPAHWDVIEGQGSLFHPGYAAVTLGLLHGSQPDALVLCHDAARTEIDEYPGFAIPDIEACIARYEEAARLTNSAARCVGIALNTSGLAAGAREPYLAELRERTGLACVDPMAEGAGAVADALDASADGSPAGVAGR